MNGHIFILNYWLSKFILQFYLLVLAIAHEVENTLLLLQIELKHRPATLKRVFKPLIQMQRCPYFNKCSKFALIIFNKESTLLILVDKSMKSGHWDIVDPDICVVASSKPHLVCVVEVNDVQLSLFLGFILVTWADLVCFYHHKVWNWFLYFKNLMLLPVYLERVFELFFAKFTMECFPSISCNMRHDFFVFSSRSPLLKTFEVHKLHWSRAFTRRQKWIFFFRVFFKAYPTELTLWILTLLVLILLWSYD